MRVRESIRTRIVSWILIVAMLGLGIFLQAPWVLPSPDTSLEFGGLKVVFVSPVLTSVLGLALLWGAVALIFSSRPMTIENGELAILGFPRKQRVRVDEIDHIGLNADWDKDEKRWSYLPVVVCHEKPPIELQGFRSSSETEGLAAADRFAEMLGVPGPEADQEWSAHMYWSYWEGRSSRAAMLIVDGLLAVTREATDDYSWQLEYDAKGTGESISLTRHGTPDDFFIVQPQKSRKSLFVATEIKLPDNYTLTTRLENAGMDVRSYAAIESRYKLRLTEGDLTERRSLLIEIIQRATGSKPSFRGP